MRLYELAKIHGIDRKQLLTAMQAQGFDIKNDIASIDDQAKQWVDDQAARGFPTIEAMGGPKPIKRKKTTPPGRALRPETAEPTPAPAAAAPVPAAEPADDGGDEQDGTRKSVKKVKRKKPMRRPGEEPEPEPAAPAPEPAAIQPVAEEPAAKAPVAPAPAPAAPAPVRAHHHPAPDMSASDRVARFEAQMAKARQAGGKGHKEKDKAPAAGKHHAPAAPAKPVARDIPTKPSAPSLPGQEVDPETLLIKGGEDQERSMTGQKHKRADFKAQHAITELPAMFTNLDAEYTRSIRGGSSGGGRRRGGRGGGRQSGGRNRQRGGSVQRERDPNAVAEVAPGMTIRELSVAMGIKLSEIIGMLMKSGQMALANDILPEEAVELIAAEFKVNFAWKAQQDLEEELEEELQTEGEGLETDKAMRPPIITFMGHVDHGKTSLLDKIRETRVTEGESGGITQHIGAYSIMKNGHPITFLDTPGHEAFTAMRARGANMTDIVVLVVAADDGVMPQTKEACSHARHANVPVIVAINKVDIPGANPDRVRQELSTQLDLLPEEWGGKVGMVEVSAITGQGIDTLLERILLEAEMMELKANPDRNAIGHVVESRMSESRGVETTIIVKDGTLHRGDVILCSNAYGKVKLMFNAQGRTVDEVKPGYAASITGLNNVPEAGDSIYVLDDILKARAIAEQRERETRAAALARRKHVTLDNLTAYLADKKTQTLNVILKADVQGSLEVLQNTLNDLSGEEVKINIVHAAVGGINQADVILADASDALIIGFHVVADQAARLQAASHSVQIKVYHIIYRIVEDMKAAISGMLPPEEREVAQGRIEVRQVFKASRIGNIAGCHVSEGVVTRHSRLRVIRDNIVVYDGEIDTLKRVKDDVKEVRAGFECGLTMKKFDNFQEGDLLESYIIEEVARTLD